MIPQKIQILPANIAKHVQDQCEETHKTGEKIDIKLNK